MAQTTLTIYAGDQLFKCVDIFSLFLTSLTVKWNSYFARLTATFIGLIVGLIVWYVGESYSCLDPPLVPYSFRERPHAGKCLRNGGKRRCLPCAPHVHPIIRS